MTGQHRRDDFLLAPLILGFFLLLQTSTVEAFGRQQWAMGSADVLGYKTKKKKMILGVFSQYFFGIGSRGDPHWRAQPGFGA